MTRLSNVYNNASGSDYAQLSEELWSFFHRVYGGGPEVVLRPPCQRTGTGSSVGCNNSGSTLQPPPVSRTAPAAPESPLGMANAHKACSIENIATSHVGASGMSGGFGTVFHPAGRAQSVSSDNITVRMAALSASGNKPSENTDSKGQETGKEACNILQRNLSYCLLASVLSFRENLLLLII